jgi:hypothetical protein
MKTQKEEARELLDNLHGFIMNNGHEVYTRDEVLKELDTLKDGFDSIKEVQPIDQPISHDSIKTFLKKAEQVVSNVIDNFDFEEHVDISLNDYTGRGRGNGRELQVDFTDADEIASDIHEGIQEAAEQAFPEYFGLGVRE